MFNCNTDRLLTVYYYRSHALRDKKSLANIGINVYVIKQPIV